MNQEKWFERTFDPAVPTTRFPGILERLRGTPARLEERTRSLPHPVLTQRHDNRWSVQENVGHLLDLEPLWLRRTEQLFAGDKELVTADLTNRRTHEANHNNRNLAGLLRDFRAARTHLVFQLGQADDGVLGRSAIHPRLRTPMRLVDLALFVAEHDDHHLATIAALLGGAPGDAPQRRSDLAVPSLDVRPVDVQQVVALLAVRSMDASLRFYVDGLGFRMTDRWIHDGKLEWCWLQVGDAALMLQEVVPPEKYARELEGRIGLGMSLNFICRDALAFYHNVKDRGITTKRPFVGNRMWVTSLKDPDGYDLHFESSTDMPEEMEYEG